MEHLFKLRKILIRVNVLTISPLDWKFAYLTGPPIFVFHRQDLLAYALCNITPNWMSFPLKPRLVICRVLLWLHDQILPLSSIWLSPAQLSIILQQLLSLETTRVSIWVVILLLMKPIWAVAQYTNFER